MRQFYRVKATGQWCEPSYEGGGAAADAIAETLGLAPGSVELVESEDDPRTGECICDPNIGESPVPSPDPAGFKGAALETLGLVTTNTLLRQWPTFSEALTAQNWPLAHQIVDVAAGAGDVTAEQQKTLHTLLVEHHIPLP